MEVPIGKENLLERFVVMGKLTETVNVLGQEITIQILDSGEQREVFELTVNKDALARMRGIQHETLARAIVSINGSPISYVAKEKEEKVSKDMLITQNLETLKQANQGVVDLLFDKYEELNEKQNANIEDLKKKYKSHGQEPDGRSENKSE